MGSKRRIVPVFGGLTAAATAAGAVAPLAQAAVAAPAQDEATTGTGELGLAQDGVFESCSAYFGFGKEDGVGNVTGFEVADVSGAPDGAGHAVPTDVQVVLVIEFAEGEPLECTPEAITEAEWDAEMDLEWNWIDAPAFPAHPVYAYPSYTEGPDLDRPSIEGFGEPVAVGFRVVGVPGGHTLVTPPAVQPLPDHFADITVLFEPETPPSVLAHLESLSPALAAAYDDARQACDDGDPIDGTDADLLAAANALRVLVGFEGDLTEVDCNDILFVAIDPVLVLGLLATAAHIEPITLAAPEAQVPTTVPPAPTPPAAQPVVAAPDFTG